jgi:putative tryptophan/tyrosine transport system substrate-binding protein
LLLRKMTGPDPIPPVANPCCNRILFGVVLASVKAMRRRDFIKVIAGSATVWPLAAHAQLSETPVIGFLSGGTTAGYAPYAAAVRRGLKEADYVEGQNVAIEYRWAQGQNDRLPTLAADLVGRPVAVIVAGGVQAALAAKAATTKIPIVFEGGPDPVEVGLVSSLNRPGGNITGVSNFSAVLVAKQFELLHETVPNSAKIGVLVKSSRPAMAVIPFPVALASRRRARLRVPSFAKLFRFSWFDDRLQGLRTSSYGID